MFANLKPKAAFSNARKNVIASMFGRMYEDTMEQTITTQYGRGPEYRPSSFPTCSILTMLKLAKGASNGHFEGSMTASGGFFTSVGTAAHENIQYYIGQSGKVWGDWKCKNPTCQKRHDAQDLFNEKGECWRKGILTRKNTTNNKCPKCKHPMEYVEKCINYKGLKGHIDAIVKLSGGGWWVADYKTSTKYQITNARSKLPHRAHLKQIPTYCYVLQKKYKMKIAGFSILYLSRDNPFMFHEHAELWNDQWMKRTKAIIAGERRKFSAGVASFHSRDPKHAIKHKPCSCLAQYEKEIDFYDPCPMLDVCFKPGLNQTLKLLLKALPYTDKARDKLVSRMPPEVLPVKLLD